MILCQITLPLLDNDGVNLNSCHWNLEVCLIECFNGYTSWLVSGAWRENFDKPIIRENSFLYQIAIDRNQIDMFRNIVKSICKEAGQKFIYVVIDSKPEFISN